MDSKERQKEIVDYVNETNKVFIQELIQKFDKSEQTIRNDLRFLEEQNLLQRIHGGAIKKDQLGENPYRNRISKNKNTKELIGKVASNLIEENDVIFLDSGTSILALVDNFPRDKRFKIITSALHIADRASSFENVEVHIIGGILNSNLKEIYGPKTISEISNFNANKAFLSISGFDIKKGLTENHILSAEVKKAMLKTAKEIIVLADSSKEGKVNFETVATFEDVDIFITDNGISQIFRKGLSSLDTKLIIATE